MTKTVSIFVPAYNEEKNIKKLLEQILNQKQKNYMLEKILVVSDASTDKTDQMVLSLHSPLIELVSNTERKGKWFGFTIAQKKLTSDYIISLDADITILCPTFFSEMVKTLESKDITSPKIIPYPPKTLLQKIFATGWNIATQIYKNNLPYTELMLCHGRCIGTTNILFTKIIWQPTFGTDAFMYLWAKKNNYAFQQTPSLIQFYLPISIKDFSLQTQRACLVRKKMHLFFGDFSEKTYTHIRLSYYIYPIFLSLCKHPLLTLGYIFVRIKSIGLKEKQDNVLWHIASSTK